MLLASSWHWSPCRDDVGTRVNTHASVCNELFRAVQTVPAFAQLDGSSTCAQVSMLLRELAAVVPDAPAVLELKAELAYAGMLQPCCSS